MVIRFSVYFKLSLAFFFSDTCEDNTLIHWHEHEVRTFSIEIAELNCQP